MDELIKLANTEVYNTYMIPTRCIGSKVSNFYTNADRKLEYIVFKYIIDIDNRLFYPLRDIINDCIYEPLKELHENNK